MSKACLIVATLLALCASSHAQTLRWPGKPVRVIVPVSPGGGTDIMARTLATKLSAEYGQAFVIDNRGGGGGTIGAETTVRAAPDGYTLAVMGGSYAANAALYKLPYDAVRDITPISILGTGPFVIAVHPSVKAATLKELIELARARPDALAYGSSGVGSTLHLAGELFRQMSKTELLHVPYKGGGAANADLLGGHIQVIFGPAVQLLPLLRSGHVRGIATAGEQRMAQLPELPTVNEMLPGYTVHAWYNFWGPRGMPNDIVRRLNASVGRVLKQPEVIEWLRGEGMQPAHTTPAEFAVQLEREVSKWTRVVRTGNIKAN